MEKTQIGDLNEKFTAAEAADSSLFAEQKSNVLIVNSEHYKNVEKSLRGRSDLNSLSEKQKIRIVRNHTQRITNRYIDGIMGLSPELKVLPHSESEHQDKKSAELYQSVLNYGKDRYKLDELKEDWCSDLVEIGECAVKVYYDKMRGEIKAYKQLMQDGIPIYLDSQGKLTPFANDQMTGQPNKPAPDKTKPEWSGDFIFETILPFDLLRDPEAASMDDSAYLIIRKMMDIETLKLMIPKDDKSYEDKMGFIKSSGEQTYRVFDTQNATFSEPKDKVMLREFYYRPCHKYPQGYYFITTDAGILFEGELPAGVFPIAYRGFKKIQTSPRSRSVIKVLRPFQYELNRMASAMVEHQLSNGSDKIFTPPGGKVTQGKDVGGGVKHFSATGTPVIVEGRVGSQYIEPYMKTLEEMYQVVDMMIDEDEMPSQLDPNSLMFRSMSRKKKYGKYAKQFQSFLKDVYWIYLKLAKVYFDDQRVIRAAGRNEQVNLPEFRAADELSVQIKLVSSSEDADSMLAKSMLLTQQLQYVGKDLPKGAMAKILTNMPFVNGDQIFASLTLTEKNIENDFLAMDRGEPRQAETDDDHAEYITALTGRIKSPAFDFLAPEIQQMYLQKRDDHRMMEAEAQRQILLAQQQAIPMTGNLVKVDVYEMVNGKQVRMTLPADAVNWLKDKLNQQGMSQERLGVLQLADQAAIADQMNQQQSPQMAQGDMNGNADPTGYAV